MADYINREDVIEKLTTVFKLQAETAKAIVDSIPSADVVEWKTGGRISNVIIAGLTKILVWYIVNVRDGNGERIH